MLGGVIAVVLSGSPSGVIVLAVIAWVGIAIFRNRH